MKPLSPCRPFRSSTQADDEEARTILQGIATPEAIQQKASEYLATARRDDGAPFDPVARFHLGNGAQIYAVHGAADLSEHGRSHSSGAMVYYHYDMALREQNHERFVQHGLVSMTDTFRATLSKQIGKTQRMSA